MQKTQVSVLWLSAKEERERDSEKRNSCQDLLNTCFGTHAKCSVFEVAVAAFHGDKAVGFAGLRKCEMLPPLYLVECVCVHPSHRRNGIASGILKKLDTLNVQKALYVDKTKNHKWLLKMYKQHGFREVKTHLFLPISADLESLLTSVPKVTHLPQKT